MAKIFGYQNILINPATHLKKIVDGEPCLVNTTHIWPIIPWPSGFNHIYNSITFFLKVVSDCLFIWLKEIAKDSVLSRCKIIAEPWDCGGLYLVGKFPNWDR